MLIAAATTAMLFHSVAILACALGIAAHAAASPTASVDALDQRDGLMVRVDVDASEHLSILASLLAKSFIGDVLDNVNLGQKRNDDDDSLINVVVGQYRLSSSWWLFDGISPGLSNILNNATVNVGK